MADGLLLTGNGAVESTLHLGVFSRLDGESRFGYVRAIDGSGTFIFVVGVAVTYRAARPLKVG